MCLLLSRCSQEYGISIIKTGTKEAFRLFSIAQVFFNYRLTSHRAVVSMMAILSNLTLGEVGAIPKLFSLGVKGEVGAMPKLLSLGV